MAAITMAVLHCCRDPPTHLDDKIKKAHFIVTGDRGVRACHQVTLDLCRQVHVLACSMQSVGKGEWQEQWEGQPHVPRLSTDQQAGRARGCLSAEQTGTSSCHG